MSNLENIAKQMVTPGNGGQELLDKVRLVIYKEWKKYSFLVNLLNT